MSGDIRELQDSLKAWNEEQSGKSGFKRMILMMVFSTIVLLILYFFIDAPSLKSMLKIYIPIFYAVALFMMIKNYNQMNQGKKLRLQLEDEGRYKAEEIEKLIKEMNDPAFDSYDNSIEFKYVSGAKQSKFYKWRGKIHEDSIILVCMPHKEIRVININELDFIEKDNQGNMHYGSINFCGNNYYGGSMNTQSKMRLEQWKVS